MAKVININEEVTDEEIQNAFKHLDASESGKITKASIVKFLKRKGDDSAELNAGIIWTQTKVKIKEKEEKKVEDVDEDSEEEESEEEIFTKGDIATNSKDSEFSLVEQSKDELSNESGIGISK